MIASDELTSSEIAVGVPAYLLMAVADDGAIQFLDAVKTEGSNDGASLTITGGLSHFSWLVMNESVLTVLLEQLDPRKKLLHQPFVVTYEIFAESPALASLESLIMALNIAMDGEFKISKADPFHSTNLEYLGGGESTEPLEGGIVMLLSAFRHTHLKSQTTASKTRSQMAVGSAPN